MTAGTAVAPVVAPPGTVRFLRIIRAEVSKLSRMRGAWVLLAVMAVICAVFGNVQGHRDFSAFGLLHFSAATLAPGVIHFVTLVEYGAAVLGALWGSAEWRGRTWTTTFLLEPRRWVLVAAKLSAALIGSAVLAVLCMVALTGAACTGASSNTWPALWGQALEDIPSVVLATALIGVLWTGVGLLLRVQVLAVLVSLIFPLVISRVMVTTDPGVAKWFPDWVAQGISPPPSSLSFGTLVTPNAIGALSGPFSFAVAFPYLLALVTIFGSLAWWVVRRSDVS